MSALAQPRPRFEDLRATPRVPLAVEVSMESEHNFFAGITDNISEGGVFVATHTPPPRGAVVELALTLPGREAPFVLRGRVCWIRDHATATEGAPAGCGLQFVELAADALAAIQRFVQRRETILYDE